MTRQDFSRAGIVDAAIILKEILGIAFAEKLLSDENIPQAIIVRVLSEEQGVRRSTYRG